MPDMSSTEEATRRIRAVLERHMSGHTYAFALTGGPAPNDPDGHWCIWVMTPGSERLPLTAELIEALDGWGGVLHLQGSVPASLYIDRRAAEDGPLREVGLQMMPLAPGARSDAGDLAGDMSAIIEANGLGERRPPVFTCRERPGGWPQ
jgi:hypothetical protein